MSVYVGTVDAEGFPSVCRAVAVSAKDDLSTVTVYVPVATGQESIANIATTRRVAVGCTYPLDNTSIQLKGTTAGVRMAREDERALLEERIEQFAATLDLVGLPPHITRKLAHWPAFAVELTVEEIFDQTPGPRAGSPLA